ncbi:MAG: phage holin family protein [Phycisphaerae bacterium]
MDMSDSPPATVAPPPASRLVDVPSNQPLFRAWIPLLAVGLFLLIVVAGAIVVFLARLVTQTFHPGVATLCVGGVVFLILALAVFGVRSRRRLQRLDLFARQSPPPTPQEILQYVARNYPLDLIASRPSILAAALARAGHAGVAVRTGRMREPFAVEPLALPIEPLGLNEFEAPFRQLWFALHEGRGATPHDDPSSPTGSSARRWWVLVKSNWVWLFVSPMMITNIFHLLAARAVSWHDIFWPVALLVVVVARIQLDPRAWYAVPAGVLDRGGRRLYRARESALCAAKSEGLQWIVSVSDGTHVASRILTDREFEILLRFWFSPLDPPPQERRAELM